MKFKRSLALILACLLTAASFAACSKTDGNETTPSETTGTETTGTETTEGGETTAETTGEAVLATSNDIGTFDPTQHIPAEAFTDATQNTPRLRKKLRRHPKDTLSWRSLKLSFSNPL